MSGPPDPSMRERLNERLRSEGLDSLVEQLRREAPEAAEKVDLRNPIRVIRALERQHTAGSAKRLLPKFRKGKLAILPDMQSLEWRIGQRVASMVQNGWVREVDALRLSGYGPEDPGFRAIGYRQMWEHLMGQVGLDEAMATTIAETRRYAKRQRTWLRKEPNLLSIGESDPLGHLTDWVNALK